MKGEDYNLFEDMQKIKQKINLLKKKYKSLEGLVIDNNPTKIQMEGGTFTKTVRDTYKTKEPDKKGLIKLMGLACYKEHSTIAKTGIIKGIGKKGFEKALDEELIYLSRKSIYYTYKETK